MRNITCQVFRDDRNADFHQLSILVEDIRAYLDSFRSKQGSITISSFEISPQLVTPLQNLDNVLTMLFKETETEMSEEQTRYLTICKRMVASFYCYIHHFIELHEREHETIMDGSEHARKLAFEFYFNAAYELRTPYFVLKGYAQSPFLKFIDKVYRPPFVPENQSSLDKIVYWIEELGKFIVELPNLCKANERKGAA